MPDRCHSLTHAHYAGWHVGQQQRYPTPACSRPVSEWYPRCDGGFWVPLPQFNARCTWVTLVSAYLLVSSEGLCGRCCLALFSSHVWSISNAFAWWWCPCCLDDSRQEDVVWRWSRARIFAGFFYGTWCGRWTVCWGRFQSSASIQSRTVGWKVHSSGTVLAWSWYCTGMTSICCLAFWRRSWPGWGNFWCGCLLHCHAWQWYQGRWILRLLEDPLLQFDRQGVWDIQHHHFFLILADLQAYFLCKHAETGGFFLHVLMSLWDQS